MPTNDRYLETLSETLLRDNEGQLSVDILETSHLLVIRAAIAGVTNDDLDIDVTADTVTIRGKRHHGWVEEPGEVAHIAECFWGAFSRSIVLPSHVKPDEADAELRNGILTIRLKKAEMSAKLPVR